MTKSTGGELYTPTASLQNECPVYDIKQSNSEVPVMLEIWGMQSTPSLPLLIDSYWAEVVAPDSVLSMG